MERHEGWHKAQDIKVFYEAHKGERYNDYMKLLRLVEIEQTAYGDWRLYVDNNENYYEDYFSIGD